MYWPELPVAVIGAAVVSQSLVLAADLGSDSHDHVVMADSAGVEFWVLAGELITLRGSCRPGRRRRAARSGIACRLPPGWDRRVATRKGPPGVVTDHGGLLSWGQSRRAAPGWRVVVLSAAEPPVLGDPAGGRAVPAGLPGAVEGEVDRRVA